MKKIKTYSRKMNKKSFSKLFAFMLFILSCTVALFQSVPANAVVLINNNGEYSELKLLGEDIYYTLKYHDIEIQETDDVTIEECSNGDYKVTIREIIKVDILFDDELCVLTTPRCTVGEALEQLSIELGENDIVSLPTDKLLSDGDKVIINRVEINYYTKEEAIAYSTLRLPKISGNVSLKKLASQKGKNGLKELTYKQIIVDGVVVSDELVSEEIIKEPVHATSYYNTLQQCVVKNGPPASYKKKLVCEATAYYGHTNTAMGIRPTVGVIAVDPKVIPLGSKVYIESADGNFVYGYAIAADVGGAIKGNKVDLFMPDRTTCYTWGRRKCVVYVLD